MSSDLWWGVRLDEEHIFDLRDLPSAVLDTIARKYHATWLDVLHDPTDIAAGLVQDLLVAVALVAGSNAPRLRTARDALQARGYFVQVPEDNPALEIEHHEPTMGDDSGVTSPISDEERAAKNAQAFDEWAAQVQPGSEEAAMVERVREQQRAEAELVEVEA